MLAVAEPPAVDNDVGQPLLRPPASRPGSQGGAEPCVPGVELLLRESGQGQDAFGHGDGGRHGDGEKNQIGRQSGPLAGREPRLRSDGHDDPGSSDGREELSMTTGWKPVACFGHWKCLDGQSRRQAFARVPTEVTPLSWTGKGFDPQRSKAGPCQTATRPYINDNNPGRSPLQSGVRAPGVCCLTGGTACAQHSQHSPLRVWPGGLFECCFCSQYGQWIIPAKPKEARDDSIVDGCSSTYFPDCARGGRAGGWSRGGERPADPCLGPHQLLPWPEAPPRSVARSPRSRASSPSEPSWRSSQGL